MRVIGGSARGRTITAPRGSELRPTSDRAREAIFDVLSHLDVLEGATVLDLFAGSGALGIEALSRGAASVTFVEERRTHAAAITDNLVATGFSEASARVLCTEVGRFLRANRESFSLCFADPPYSFSGWPELLSELPGDLVVLESSRPIELDSAHELHRVYRYGGTLVTVARRVAGGAGGDETTRGGPTA
jgi:16S rRNA (guanine966-N2)-methyltransferase